jgi:long-chain acyl-CoA synthetase
VQLAAAIEQKMGLPPESGVLESVQTLGELRAIVSGSAEHAVPREVATSSKAPTPEENNAAPRAVSPPPPPASAAPPAVSAPTTPLEKPQRNYVYPKWPWRPPVTWIRYAFIEAVMRPLVRFLAKPRVTAPADLQSLVSEPILIIANHITTYDGPLVQYALPGTMRRHIAAAMSGEMLDDFRHARNPEPGPRYGRFYPFGPPAWFLITALFNVFPLPRLRDFQRSFSHAGEALDHGYHVLVFPEGTRSSAGQLAPFRPGIGLLVRQAGTAVLPVALRGLGELKAHGRGWFRSGALEVRVGKPIRFAPDATETEITARLHDEVRKLLAD